MALATIGVTIPSFVIATALLYIFSFQLGWTPMYGVDKWQGYILPMIAMGGYSVSFLARLMRSSLLDVMGQGRGIVTRHHGQHVADDGSGNPPAGILRETEVGADKRRNQKGENLFHSARSWTPKGHASVD